MGDIHGAFPLVAHALTQLEFDPRADRLICAGDLVDRGQYNTEARAFLNEPWVVSGRGNHEQMLLDAYEWGDPDPRNLPLLARNGAGWFEHASVQHRRGLLEAFRAMPLAIEVETPHGLVGVIHAEVPVGMSWQECTRRLRALDGASCLSAMWGRERASHDIVAPVDGVWRVFCGHTVFARRARWKGNVCFADTGAHMACDGKHGGENSPFGLTMLDMAGPRKAPFFGVPSRRVCEMA